MLGLDWGERRIGIAISDPSRLLATPLAVLRRRTGKRLPLRDFLSLVELHHPVALVVGLALDDQGKEGASACAAREMASLFSIRAELPLHFHDESFSTLEAADLLGQSRPRLSITARLRSEQIDAAAAAVMLQSWLDQQRARAR